MSIKTKEDLDLLIQEYNNSSNEILRELYQILTYSESSISRQDLFVMSRKEKDILIDVMKEKVDQENKAMQK